MKIKVEDTKSLTGIILLTGISTVIFGIFTKDLNLLWFSLPIIFSLIIAVSRSRKDIDDAVASIGITSSNIRTSIPLGVSAGILVYIVGSMLLSFTDKNTASIVPTFAIASLTPANTLVIPASLFLIINVFIQWLVVAPSEELGFRFLAPYAIYSFTKSVPVALILGTFAWIFTHIPTFLIQGASSGMYIVLFILGIVAIALIYFTGDIVSAWISHATFNTLVIISTAVFSTVTLIILVSLLTFLSIFYVTSGGSNAKKQSPFNL
jgi:hypothetical protein